MTPQTARNDQNNITQDSVETLFDLSLYYLLLNLIAKQIATAVMYLLQIDNNNTNRGWYTCALSTHRSTDLPPSWLFHCRYCRPPPPPPLTPHTFSFQSLRNDRPLKKGFWVNSLLDYTGSDQKSSGKNFGLSRVTHELKPGENVVVQLLRHPPP